MKKELAFKMLEKPPPGRDALGKFTTNHPLRKLYASKCHSWIYFKDSSHHLLELPFGAIVFYRLQKDRGGFADGKDHNVKGERCSSNTVNIIAEPFFSLDRRRSHGVP